jgi:hypothetical protein
MLRPLQPVRNADSRPSRPVLRCRSVPAAEMDAWAMVTDLVCPAGRLPPGREWMRFRREVPRANFNESNSFPERCGIRATGFAPVFEDFRRAPKADLRERSACVIGSLLVVYRQLQMGSRRVDWMGNALRSVMSFRTCMGEFVGMALVLWSFGSLASRLGVVVAREREAASGHT